MVPVLLLAALGNYGEPEINPLAAEARAVFVAKCSQCHGADLVHPKAGFGFITDLSRLAASPEHIVPGDPEKSEVWKQIAGGDMPPDSAKAGPLTTVEKQTVYDWIKAGAPVPATSPGILPARPDIPPATRILEFVGRFHVVIIHFPVALLLCAAAAEGVGLIRRIDARATRFCFLVGAAATPFAAGLGWLRALGMADEPFTLLWVHRWLGVALSVSALVVAWALLRTPRDTRAAWPLRTAIIAVGLLAAATGHFGGLLTHGPRFFQP